MCFLNWMMLEGNQETNGAKRKINISALQLAFISFCVISITSAVSHTAVFFLSNKSGNITPENHWWALGIYAFEFYVHLQVIKPILHFSFLKNKKQYAWVEYQLQVMNSTRYKMVATKSIKKKKKSTMNLSSFPPPLLSSCPEWSS